MTSPNIRGTTLTVRFDRVVDGDTIKVILPTSPTSESIRILCIDTEESSSFGSSSKPVTPWGKAAKQFAKSFFADTNTITLEFPDTSPLEDALLKHRGSYGRLLVFVHKADVDFSETMIARAYSPYYNKYGNAPFVSHHRRYRAAERAAQAAAAGVWDQLTVNGAVRRAYPALTTWWALRAGIIDSFRRLRRVDPSLLDAREDYARILELARDGAAATVFAEVRDIRRTAAQNAVATVDSRDKPFTLFIPDVDDGDDAPGSRVVRLLRIRYISDGAVVPRRSYCFVTGRLSLYRGTPQMLVSTPAAVTDAPRARALDVDEERDEGGVVGAADKPAASDGVPWGVGGLAVDGDGVEAGTGPRQPMELPTVSARIAAALPDPVGRDAGNEKLFIRGVHPDGDVTSPAGQPGRPVPLDGWKVRDSGGSELRLDGLHIAVGETVEVAVVRARGSLMLRNRGDELLLLDKRGRIVDSVEYKLDDVMVDGTVTFDGE